MSLFTLRFLNRLADAFVAGRTAFVATHFAYPQPVFHKEHLQVFGTAEMLTEALDIYLEQARAIGVTQLRPRIIADGLPVREYSSIWVEWDHLNAAGKCLRTSQVRYTTYQAEEDLFPVIEMVDYTHMAFPQVLQLARG